MQLLHNRLNPQLFTSRLLIGERGEAEGSLEFGGPEEGIERIPGLKRKVDPRVDFSVMRRLTLHLEQSSTEIVHTHMAKAGALGRLAARRAQVPLVVHTYHGHVLEGYFPTPVNRTLVAAERYLARRTDILIAVSSATRDELLSLGIGRTEQWRVVPLGLDLSDLLHNELPQETARSALGLPLTGPVVGIVGRLVPIKDHSTFLQAAAQISRARPDVTFVVAGDGEMRAEIERQAQTAVPNRVIFLGWTTDLVSLYAALDVVVLTSRNEGTPVALIEAGAASRPTVASDVGGVSSVIQDADTGFLTRPGDARDISQRVLSFIENPAMGRVMGDAAREWVRDRFSAERLVNDMSCLYREEIAHKRRIGRPQ